MKQLRVLQVVESARKVPQCEDHKMARKEKERNWHKLQSDLEKQ